MVNNPGNPLTVTLGKVSKNSFTATDATSSPIAFSIKLINCPSMVTRAKVKFDETPLGGIEIFLK